MTSLDAAQAPRVGRTLEDRSTGLSGNKPIQSQIGHSPTETSVLRLKGLHLLQLT